MTGEELVIGIYKQIMNYLADSDLKQKTIYDWETNHKANVKRLIRSFICNLPDVEEKNPEPECKVVWHEVE